MKEKKSIIFFNQSSGYLMIDIINAHVPYYDELVLFTGVLNTRNIALDPKVKVKYLKSYKRSGNLSRFYSWCVFHIQCLIYLHLVYRKSNIFFVSNPPINVFNLLLNNRKYSYLIYDLYPQTLEKSNLVIKSSYLYKFWIRLNKRIFENSKNVFTLSEGMKNQLNYIRNSNLIKVVPIWANNKFFKKIPINENEFITSYSLENKFVIGYTGNLGKTHPLEKIFDVAEALVSEKDIKFLIIGEGEKKLTLQNLQEKKSLPNLKILDFQPPNLFSQVLSSFHIGLVTLDKESSHLSIPSKTFDLMASSTPIISIANHDSDLAYLVKDNDIGKNFSENDKVNGIVEYILNLKKDAKSYKSACKKAKLVSQKYSNENAKKMILI